MPILHYPQLFLRRYRAILLPLLALLLLFVSSAVIAIVGYKQTTGKVVADTKEYAIRTQELSSFVTPVVTIEDSEYLLVDGIVRDIRGERTAIPAALTYLRIADYVIRTRFDPIMALAGVNIEQLQIAIQDLTHSMETLAPYYSDKEMERIRKTLYPVAFLHTLPALELARRQLQEKPSQDTVKVYDRALATSLAAYRVSIDTLQEAFLKEIERKERQTGTSYNFPGGSTNLAHFTNTLAQLRTRAQWLEEERERRLSCFLGQGVLCQPLAEAVEEATSGHLTVDLSEIVRPSGSAPQEVREVNRLLTEFLDSRNSFRGKIAGLEMIKLSRSSCHSGSGSTYYTTWNMQVSDQTLALQYAPLDDLLFYDTPAVAGESRYFITTVAAGLLFLHQSLGNLYMCPDNGLEAARLSTIASVSAILARTPVFTTLPPQKTEFADMSRLAEYEQKIISSTVLSETDVAVYLQDIGILLKQTGEKNLAERIGENKVLVIEQLLLVVRSQSALFDRLVSAVTNTNAGLAGILEDGGKLSVGGLYMSRGGQMQLLLAFNDTVIESPISFFAVLTPLYLEKFKLISYRDLLKKDYLLSDILDIMIRSDEFYFSHYPR